MTQSLSWISLTMTQLPSSSSPRISVTAFSMRLFSWGDSTSQSSIGISSEFLSSWFLVGPVLRSSALLKLTETLRGEYFGGLRVSWSWLLYILLRLVKTSCKIEISTLHWASRLDNKYNLLYYMNPTFIHLVSDLRLLIEVLRKDFGLWWLN